ncbi:MAG TPA: BlaI/MecI/CopY family transcriptional regulator [Vicinamibacterales bacterium]
MTPRLRDLGRVEQAVMDHVWAHGPITAEACREGLRTASPMKESTMRTVLRRLEAKGYVHHSVEGRTYIYQAAEGPVAVAARAVKHIIDRLCGGSAEALVVGMVAHDVLSPKQLERLTLKIAQQKRAGKE